MGDKANKLLSFGCSTGREAATLATKNFPNAIYGVDETPEEAERFYKEEASIGPESTFFSWVQDSH